MVVDTSAIVAVLFGEPEREAFLTILGDADTVVMSAVSYLEATMVLSRQISTRNNGLDAFLEHYQVEVEPADLIQARLASEAFLRFGKGRGHPAQLNFGDCLVYALAMSRSEPLLFKGDDFSQTDVLRAA